MNPIEQPIIDAILELSAEIFLGPSPKNSDVMESKTYLQILSFKAFK